jgi:hypothetical protein
LFAHLFTGLDAHAFPDESTLCHIPPHLPAWSGYRRAGSFADCRDCSSINWRGRDQEAVVLVMMRYRFGSGPAGRQAYERFAQWTPSDGFEIKAGWTSAGNDGGFLLLDVVDVASLLEFSAKFKDLNDELEITPVVELGEGVSIAMKAYAWIDSLSSPQ